MQIYINVNNDKGDILEEILPKYLFREQYKKAVTALDELYEWTKDEFIHEIDCFHQVLLYYFLQKIYYIQKENNNFFKQYYFTNAIKKDIEKCARLEYQKEDCENTLTDIINLYYDINYYIDILFEDLDFFIYSRSI